MCFDGWSKNRWETKGFVKIFLVMQFWARFSNILAYFGPVCHSVFVYESISNVPVQTLLAMNMRYMYGEERTSFEDIEFPFRNGSPSLNAGRIHKRDRYAEQTKFNVRTVRHVYF